MIAMDHETEAPHMTPKVCRCCRKWYLSPKGSRWIGCRTCYPQIGDAPTEPVFVFTDDGYPANVDLQHGDEIPF